MNALSLSHFWNSFQNSHSPKDFELLTIDLFKNHNDLLDLTTLNFQSIGPAISDFSENAQQTLFKGIKESLQDMDNEPHLNHTLNLVKMLCLFARNPENLMKLHDHESVQNMYDLVQLTTNKLSQMNKENMNSWLQIFSYSLYYLECIYDPNFTWRRRKGYNIVYEDQKNPSDMQPLSMTIIFVPWFCECLDKVAHNSDLTSQLVHLFCSVICGSVSNSAVAITFATVDALRSSQDVCFDSLVSFCCVVTRLTVVEESERQEDLSSLVGRLMSAFTSKISFTDEELVSTVSWFNAIASGVGGLLFTDQGGYETLKKILKHGVHCPDGLIQELFNWMIGEKFESSQLSGHRYRVQDGNIVRIFLAWSRKLESRVSEEAFDWLLELLRSNRNSQSECCSCNVISLAARSIQRATDSSDIWINQVLSVVQVLGKHSVASADWCDLLAIFNGATRHRVGRRLLQTLDEISSHVSAPITHSFELTSVKNGICLIPAFSENEPHQKLSDSGFTFLIRHSLGHPCHLTAHRRCLLRILTKSGHGLEAFFTANGRKLIVIVCEKGHPGSIHEIELDGFFLDAVTFHTVRIVLWKSSWSFFGQASMSVWIDGLPTVEAAKIKYPHFSEEISLLAIGGSSHSTNHELPGGDVSWSDWGLPGSLMGDVSWAVGFTEAIPEPATVQAITNPVSVFLDNENMSSKVAFLIHPEACDGSWVRDLAPAAYGSQGVLSGQCRRGVHITKSIEQVGGISVLLPLIDKLADPDLTKSWLEKNNKNAATERTSDKDVSPLACIFRLLRHHLQSKTNQQHASDYTVIPILGHLLEKVDPNVLDQDSVTECQSLITSLSDCLYEEGLRHIFLNWGVWSRASVLVREAHLFHVATFLKSGRVPQEEYNMAFFLEVLHKYHSTDDADDDPFGTSEDPIKCLRTHLFDIVKKKLMRNTTLADLKDVVRFIHGCHVDELISGGLSLLMATFDNHSVRPQLLYAKGLIDSLYALLVRPTLGSACKASVVKLLHAMLVWERTSDQDKSRLLLEDCFGFSGLFTSENFFTTPFSDASTQRFVEIMKKAAVKDLQGVVQLLGVYFLASPRQKVYVLRLLDALFKLSDDAINAVRKQPAWVDLLVHMLASKPRSGPLVHLTLHPHGDDGRRRTIDYEDVNGVEGSETEFDVSTSIEASQLEDNRSSTNTIEDESPQTLSFHHRMSSPNVQPSKTSMPRSQSIANTPLSQGRQSLSVSVDGDADLSETVATEEVVSLVRGLILKLVWSDKMEDNDEAWQSRYEVFACLQDVEQRYVLIKSALIVKQQILQKLMEDSRQQIVKRSLFETPEVGLRTALSNAWQLICAVVDTVSTECVAGNPDVDIDNTLVDLTLSLLDLLYTREPPDSSRAIQLLALRFAFLLGLTRSSNQSMASQSCARLHDCLFSGDADALPPEAGAYLLSQLVNILRLCDEGSDTLYSLVPVVRSALHRWGYLLDGAPGLPAPDDPKFCEAFLEVSKLDKWDTFLSDKLSDGIENYECEHLSSVLRDQSMFRATAQESLLKNRKERRRLLAGSRAAFDRVYLQSGRDWAARCNRYRKRTKTDLLQREEDCETSWKIMKDFLGGPRGLWREKNSLQTHWRLCLNENRLRERPKLEPNPNFKSHEEAARSRDWPNENRASADLTNGKSTEALLAAMESVACLKDGQRVEGVVETELEESGDFNLPSEKVHLSVPCQRVTIRNVVDGQLDLYASYMTFRVQETEKEKNEELEDSDYDCYSDISCDLSLLREIHLRRYNLRRSALEFFLRDHRNFFLNFDAKTRDVVYHKILHSKPKNLIYSTICSPADLLKKSRLTEKWVNREISNFQYLMQLNTIAGRTYNDLSQYPVFPWVLADYTSQELDLTKESTFRDLSRPIGIANPDNIEDVQEKFESFEDTTGGVARFHYGTHYSSSAGVMHYLARLEPFTSLHVKLHGGKFDIPNRQFHSIPTTWQFIMDSPNDNKELTPEFFYLPQILRNSDGYNLGSLHPSGIQVDDVILPPWAKSPEDFIRQHRRALESDFVSSRLHLWIDLIFGYRQTGEAAREALNVYYYVTYEGAVNWEAIEEARERVALEAMINNFGQTPCQLLTEPHPARFTQSEILEQCKDLHRPPPLLLALQKIRFLCNSPGSPDDPIVFAGTPRLVAHRPGIVVDRVVKMVTVSGRGIMGNHYLTPTNRNGRSDFVVELDGNLTTDSGRRKAWLGPLTPGIYPGAQMVALSSDGTLLLWAGRHDASLGRRPIPRGKASFLPTGHTDILTCLALDATGDSMISGSRDGTCLLWDDVTSTDVMRKLWRHTASVTCVALVSVLDLAVSGSLDETVNIYTVSTGLLLHTLEVGGPVRNLLASESGDIFVEWKDASQRDHLSSFSVNARLLRMVKIHFSVSCMSLVGNSHLLIGCRSGHLVVKDTSTLETLWSNRMACGVLSLCVVPGDTHWLATLEDGKMLIISATID